MAADDGSLFQSRLRDLIRAKSSGGQGVNPALIRALGPEGAQQASTFGTQAVSRSGQAARALGQRPGMATAGALGIGNLLQGDVLGAAASTVGGLAGGGAGSALAGMIPGRMIPGPVGKIVKFGLPIAGALMGGRGLEQAVQGLAGKSAEAAQQPGAGADVEFLGVPLTATASERRQREFDRAEGVKDIQARSPAEIAAMREAIQMSNELEIQQQKALLPLTERMMRTQLVNQQAINATNAALYQQMGRTATMGRLATGAQVQAGATTRTLLSQNPYAGAVLQAPQISFG
jgi:hypothetical protein